MPEIAAGNTTRVATWRLVAPIGLVGCGEESSTTATIKQEGPGGTTEETIKKEVEQSGDNPPAPVGGTGQPAPTTP